MSQQEMSKRDSWANEVFEYAEMIFTTIAAVMLLFTFVIRPAEVYGSSMYPTLEGGDRLLISKLFYEPKQGDIVVIPHPNMPPDEPALIKRVIALEGQTVDIDFETGDVWVDGELLDEPYINEPTYDQQDFEGPLTVPKGEVFVLGDNRNASSDSRSAIFGTFDEDYILGRCIVRIAPFDKMGSVE